MATIRVPQNQSITVRSHVQAFADAVEKATGVTSFGTYNGHSPPEGPTLAIDIFVPTSPTTLGDAVAAFALKHQAKYGIRYVIWRTQIWNIERADEGWRWQRTTGNPTVDHLDHVHITFYADPGVGWSTPEEEEEEMDQETKDAIKHLSHAATRFFTSLSEAAGGPPDTYAGAEILGRMLGSKREAEQG